MSLTRRQAIALGGVGLVSLVGIGSFVGCKPAPHQPVDRHRVLIDTTKLVIVPTYDSAALGAAEIVDATARLAPGDASSVATAQAAWRRTRAAWKRADAFLFGPADDLAITAGAIDAGPPDDAKLSALVSGTAAIDEALVGTLGGNQRGFAGLEWLLFDPSGDAAVLASFDGAGGERRRTLARLIAGDLRAKIEAVRDAWQPGKGDFAAVVSEAGRGSRLYASERQGVDALVNALIAAAEVLTAIRLAKPLGLDRTPVEPHPELVESPRSGNAQADVLSALEGIEAVYACKLDDAHGVSLADAVADEVPRADEQMRSALAAARDAVRAIPAPLVTAVSSQRDAVVAAHVAVREVKRKLTTEVAGALGTSVGFNVTDGD